MREVVFTILLLASATVLVCASVMLERTGLGVIGLGLAALACPELLFTRPRRNP